MKFRSLNLSLLGSLEAQHEARQILELRFRQRHLRHDGTGRDGLRVSWKCFRCHSRSGLMQKGLGHMQPDRHHHP